MIQEIETLRMVTAVAKDLVDGVNAQIALLPLDGADPRPADLIAILSEFDDDIAVRDDDDIEFPIGLLMIADEGSTAEPEAEVGYRDGIVPIVFAYVTSTPSTPKEKRDAKYVCQAFVNSMKRGLLDSTKIAMAGERNDVQILQATSLRTPRIAQEFGIGTITSAVALGFQVRNNVV